MTLLSESSMARFTSEEIPLAAAGLNGRAAEKGSPRRVFRLRMTATERFTFAQELLSDPSVGGREYRGHLRPDSFSNWTGMPEQTPGQALTTGIVTEAVKEFETANAKLHTSMSRAAPEFSPVGASFSVGRVMVGHPKSAIIRPRAKLPPKKITLALNAWAGLSAKQIAASISRIARAAWDYKTAGGQVEIEISYLHKFSRPEFWQGVPHYGFLDTVKINPVNAAAFASAASAQMYRAISMPLASTLSGQRGDGLPLCAWGNPDAHPITGNAEADSRMLQTLKVE